ncbi:MAG: hypothetical protein ACXVX0_16790 [Blastococcus sp.]
MLVTRPLDAHALPLHLVQGGCDTVVPVEGAEACRTVGVRCSLNVVASDHAGVVGTAYDPSHGVCVPSDGAAATIGLAAALRAIDAALTGS